MTFAVGIPLFLRSSLIAFTNAESPVFRSFAEKPCSVNPFSHERTSRAHHSSRQAFFPLEGHDTRRFFGCLPSKPPVHRPVYRNIGKPCRLKTPTNTSIEAYSSNETLRAHRRDTSVFPRFLYLPGQLSPTVFALVYTNARRHDELIKLTSACFCRMIHVLHAASFSPATFLLSFFLSFFLSSIASIFYDSRWESRFHACFGHERANVIVYLERRRVWPWPAVSSRITRWKAKIICQIVSVGNDTVAFDFPLSSVLACHAVSKRRHRQWLTA